MNIISRIKSWFEPKIATTKAKVRFKNGAAIYLHTPAHAGDEMKVQAYRFVQVNRDLEKEKRLRELLQNRANSHIHYRGMQNVGIGGQMVGSAQSLMGANIWGR